MGLLTSPRRITNSLSRAGKVGHGDGAQQGLGVGVLGVGEEFVGGGHLHALPQVHHHDLVGDVLHDAHVVGDEQVGQAQFLLQVHEEVEDLGLDGDVQGRDRLVADDELGVEGEGAGDADPLAPAAVQFVGVGVGVAPGQAHQVHEVGGPVVGLGPGPVQAVDEHELGDDLQHGLAGVEAGVGILEDDLEILAQLPHLPAAHLHDVPAVVEDLAGGGLDEPDDGTAQGGLAAAGLAHHAHRLLGVDLEVDAVHGVQLGAAVELEELAQVAELDEGGPGVDGAHGFSP